MEKQKGNMFSTNDFSGLVLLLGFGRDDFVSAGGGCRVVSWRGRGFHIYFSLDRPDWRMKEINIMLIKKTYTKFYRNIRLVNVFFHP